jgi:hypothetical protein
MMPPLTALVVMVIPLVTVDLLRAMDTPGPTTAKPRSPSTRTPPPWAPTPPGTNRERPASGANWVNSGLVFYHAIGQPLHPADDPRFIGRFVDITASPQEVAVFCDGQLAARHTRSWAKQGVVTDPAHAATAQQMRHALALERQSRQAATRHHADGHVVMLRALPDYDALFGVDFNPSASVTKASSE